MRGAAQVAWLMLLSALGLVAGYFWQWPDLLLITVVAIISIAIYTSRRTKAKFQEISKFEIWAPVISALSLMWFMALITFLATSLGRALISALL
ncbi:MAG: hypothetical protein Q8O87_01195 [bacterium]|nr:hypothetical protein [bacterium]